MSLLWTCSSFGQSINHNIQKIEDKFDKLGSSFITKNAILEDSTGAIWMGTERGLCKYTGSTIDCNVHESTDANSIDGNVISYLFMDSDHLIWTAINGHGINVFDIYGKKVYDFEYLPNVTNALLHNKAWGMWEDEDGYIWISYFYGGLSRYDKENGQFEHFTLDNEQFLEVYRPKTVVAVLDHDSAANTYWLATTRGLVKFNTKTQEHKTYLFEKEIEKETSESQYNRNKVSPLWCRSMCKDQNGDLWLGTFGALVKFDTETETSEVIRNIDGTLLNIVPGVMDYDDTRIMISFGAGLALLDINTMKLTVLSHNGDAGSKYYLSGRMYKASNGCVYILTRGGQKKGVYKYCEISDFAVDYFTNHFVTNIVVTDHYVHYHRKPGQIESRHLETGEKINHTFEIENGSAIRSMFSLTGDSIVVSDVYHMYAYHPETGLTKIDELSQDDVYRHESVFVDSDGDIWNGRQREGMFWFDRRNGEIKRLSNKSNPAIVYQDYIVDFLEDDEGDIWIATEQGWTILNKESQTTRNYLSSEEGAKSDINIRTINTLAQTDEGKVWMGTTINGVIEWDKKEQKILSHINRSVGLGSNQVYDIVIDADNNLWLATDVGLSFIDSRSKLVKNFGREFGIEKATYCIDLNDEYIFAGHSSGYYKVNMDSLLNYEKPLPKPIITGFDLYDKTQDSLLNSVDGISLPNDQNFFSFSYGSINYVDPYLEKYQYKLIDVDQTWKDDRGDRRAGYTNVPPGRYEFQARVKTESEEWSEPASVKIYIRPAWYQALWFKLLMGFVTILLLVAMVKNFVARRERELEIDKRFAQLETMILKSQMNPHFVFNSLNSIRYLFMKDEKEKGLKYITKFARLLRTTLHHGDQALVRLEEEVELTELFVQLEELRFDDAFKFSSDYSSDPYWKELMIPPFVIQPIVENAFWHGLLPSKKEEKKIEISITKIETGYKIAIEDNGVGLDAKSIYSIDSELNKTKSYGLKIINERFELMNKNNELQYHLSTSDSEKNDTGTLVEIKITEK